MRWPLVWIFLIGQIVFHLKQAFIIGCHGCLGNFMATLLITNLISIPSFLVMRGEHCHGENQSESFLRWSYCNGNKILGSCYQRHSLNAFDHSYIYFSELSIELQHLLVLLSQYCHRNLWRHPNNFDVIFIYFKAHLQFSKYFPGEVLFQRYQNLITSCQIQKATKTNRFCHSSK